MTRATVKPKRGKRKDDEVIIVGEKPAEPVSRPLATPLRNLSPKSTSQNVNLRLSDKVFVPVTKEAMSKVLLLLDKFEREKRCAAVVFNSCFYLDELPLEKITEKFEPIFGPLDPEQIFVRVDMPKLTNTPEEAYKLSFKTLNQAYIVASSDCTENELNRKSAARQTFCCPMTLGCIRKNLKQGLYLMHRSIVLGPGQPKQRHVEIPVISKSKDKVEPASSNNKKTKEKPTDQLTKSPPKKRDRMAATLLISESQDTKDCPKATSSLSKSTLKNKENNQIDLDESLWKSISAKGNVALKIDNLPSKLTVNSFNLMMGTTTIKSDQVVARRRVDKNGLEVMEMMLVIESQSVDLARITEKNGLRTPGDIKLRVERSSLLKLRKFLSQNSKNLTRLEASDKLPIKWISYGKCQ